ncbi:M56 family metallopeptidase [Edaphobacter aggregans]|uniref:M56 family metallopeptidase n=1 Tax=Edaphobacter aggregans TaxID=570835 RepID=UPI00054E0EBC|nr:M56 family metallopeptidase [Edaphobacter aggregans]
MTPIVADVALAGGSSLAASLVAKATVTMVLALVGVRLARRRSAAVRHVMLAAAFAVLLALPVASILVPSVRLVQLQIVTGRTAESAALPSHAGFTPVGDRVSTVFRERATIPSSRVSASVMLLAVWAAGALLFLLPVFVGQWHVRKLRRLGQPWRDGQLMVGQLAADAGVHRRVEVLLHGAVTSPGSCGALRAIIVLPMDAPTWHEDDLSRAIIHELEHVRRGDWVSQCFARAVCACYWFHPLVWMGWRRMVLEAERACDDAVLRRAEATAYADQLLVLAERISKPPNWPLLTLANRTELAARVVAVLDSGQQRGRAGTVCLVLACIASALLVTTISPLRIVTAAQMAATTQKFTGSLVDPVSRTIPDATLTLSNVSTKQRIETQSDQSGHFSFSGLPAGEYLLQARKFGFDTSQERITLTAGQDLNRDIELQIGGIDETVTVYSSEAQAILPPPPAPLPPPSSTSQPYRNQADLDRCAQVSMFCRVMPPHRIADAQPVFPMKERESGVGGRVMIEGRIGRDGLIKDLRTLAPADTDFANAAIDALRRWQFTATRLDGVPIEVPLRVSANFVVQ